MVSKTIPYKLKTKNEKTTVFQQKHPSVGGLSAVNAIGTQLRDPINYMIGTDSMAVDGICGRRRGKREESRE